MHGRTYREECRADVLAAFATVDDRGTPRRHREGVLWHQPTATDLLFVTLKKSEALFSPTTRTRDLALGPSLRAMRGSGPWRFAGDWSGRSRWGGYR